MAAQLANIHKRDHLIMSQRARNLRKQHGHSKVAVGRSLRLLGGADDINKAPGAQAEHVRRVHFDLPAVF